MVLALAGQLFCFCLKAIIAEYQSSIDTGFDNTTAAIVWLSRVQDNPGVARYRLVHDRSAVSTVDFPQDIANFPYCSLRFDCGNNGRHYVVLLDGGLFDFLERD